MEAVVGTASSWQRLTNIVQVKRIQALSLPSSTGNDFYRAVELNLPAGDLVVTPTLVAASNLVFLEMATLPGCAYVIENSSNLVNWSQQAVAVAESGLLPFTVELDAQDTARFFRARAIPCADQWASAPTGLGGRWPGDGSGADVAGTNTPYCTAAQASAQGMSGARLNSTALATRRSAIPQPAFRGARGRFQSRHGQTHGCDMGLSGV